MTEKNLCYICEKYHEQWRDCPYRKYGDSPYRGKHLTNGHKACLLCGGDHAARNCYAPPSKMHWHSKYPDADLAGPKFDPSRARRDTAPRPTATGNVGFATLDTGADSDAETVDSQTANVEAAVEAATRTALEG